MKTFKFEEVIEWMRENPDYEVDYGNPFVKSSRTEFDDPDKPCVMCRFFLAKGIDFYEVSYRGWEALDEHGEIVARILNSPIRHIEEIHCVRTGGVMTIAGILENLEYKGYINEQNNKRNNRF